jgi:hypothetical protein
MKRIALALVMMAGVAWGQTSDITESSTMPSQNGSRNYVRQVKPSPACISGYLVSFNGGPEFCLLPPSDENAALLNTVREQEKRIAELEKQNEVLRSAGLRAVDNANKCLVALGKQIRTMDSVKQGLEDMKTEIVSTVTNK